MFLVPCSILGSLPIWLSRFIGATISKAFSCRAAFWSTPTTRRSSSWSPFAYCARNTAFADTFTPRQSRRSSPDLVALLGLLADRISVNMELPSRESLALLCPEKTKSSIISPMRQIKERIEEDKDARSLACKNACYMAERRSGKTSRAFAPAGQSTQMIIGAMPESDRQILMLSSALYASMALKRVFFSAYLPVNEDARLPLPARSSLIESIGCIRRTGSCGSTGSTRKRFWGILLF